MSRVAATILSFAVIAITILSALLEPALLAALILVAWLAGWLDYRAGG